MGRREEGGGDKGSQREEGAYTPSNERRAHIKHTESESVDRRITSASAGQEAACCSRQSAGQQTTGVRSDGCGCCCLPPLDCNLSLVLCDVGVRPADEHIAQSVFDGRRQSPMTDGAEQEEHAPDARPPNECYTRVPQSASGLTLESFQCSRGERPSE